MAEPRKPTSSVEEELTELQARVGAIELLLTDLLAYMTVEVPFMKTELEKRERSLRIGLDGMSERELSMFSTHHRYLQCTLLLLDQVKTTAAYFSLPPET